MSKAATARKPAAPVLAAEAQIPVAPLDRFAIAPENPRKIRSEEAIHELAASLASSGVITAVICYDEGGKLQITAGGTRYLAAKHARLDGLPYDLRSKDEAISAGLVEQEGHHPLHPADQAEAYAAELKRLNENQFKVAKGAQSGTLVPREALVLKVANRAGKTVRFVEQRLALAALHPPILKALRENAIGLDQASAWANAPPERQAEVWKDFGARALRLDVRGIKSALDKADLAENDRLVKFAGRERYAAQGGMIRQDLFPIGATGEIDLAARPAEHYDREAVKRAARDRLEAEANKYRKQGWGFVLTKAGSVVGAPSGYTVGKPCTTKEQKAKAGVSLSIGHDGKLQVQLNLRKQAAKKPKVQGSATQAEAALDLAEIERFDLTCQYAEQIVGRSLYATPKLALSAVLAALWIEVDGGSSFSLLVGVAANSTERDADGLASQKAAVETFNYFSKLLGPVDDDDLVTFIANLSDATRDRLLCLLVTSMIELRVRPDQMQHARVRQLASLGSLAKVKLEDHMTEEVAAKIDLPILRQLVGLDALPKAKPAAKAKKSRGSK